MSSTPVAIVTGAGRGIGRATAVELVKRGYRVAIAARTPADLAETARLAGGEVSTFAGDITAASGGASLVSDTLERFGRIDALVNNAGYAPVLSVEDLTPAEWQRIVETNLTAPIHLIRAAWPTMKKQLGGVIVNLSSAAARDPFPGLGAYGAAKAGLSLLGLALAREGHPHGIRVHTVAPSAVETGMFRAIMDHEQVPTSQVLDPTEVASVIVDCVTGSLRYTSGEVIWVHKTV